MLALSDLLRTPEKHPTHAPSELDLVRNAMYWTYPDVSLLVRLQSIFSDDSLVGTKCHKLCLRGPLNKLTKLFDPPFEVTVRLPFLVSRDTTWTYPECEPKIFVFLRDLLHMSVR